MNINNNKFEQLIKKSYTLDQIYMLSLIKDEYDVISMCEKSVKIHAIYNALIRKGLITRSDDVTLIGEELLNFINSNEKDVTLIKKVNKVGDFDLWWSVFPANNKFSYKGQDFTATRAFKTKKEECKTLFNAIVNSKEYTAKEIIEATKYDVFLKKEDSVKNRENRLKFLQNTHTYLNQKTFQGFVGLTIEDAPTISKRNFDI